VVGGVVMAIMLTWKTGRTTVTTKMRRGELPIERFIGSISDHPQDRVRGTAVYLFPEVGATPPALLANLRHNDVIHETVLIVSIKWAASPRVFRAARATIHPLGDGFFQVMLKYGFVERTDIPGALADITTADFGFDPSDAIYIVGKETIIPSTGRFVFSMRDRLFAVMQRNARSAAEFFNLPVDDVIEVGSQLQM
jgi:KUP system potassium uptake protein